MWSKLKNNIVSVCSIVIATCALVVSIYQIEKIDYHNRLSVMPALTYLIEYDQETENVHFLFKNSGLGPATISSIEYINDSFAIRETDTKKIFKHFVPEEIIPKGGAEAFFSNHRGFNVMLPGDSKNFAIISLKGMSDIERDNMIIALSYIKVGICYRSMYGDLFYLKSHDVETPKNSCRYDGVTWVFNSPIKIEFPWWGDITQEKVWGKNANN